MKKFIMAVAIAVTVMAATAPAAYADDDSMLSKLSVGTDHAFLSRYVWRGLTATNDPVWQPDVWVSYDGFTFNVWGNYELTDVNNNENRFTEFDYTLDYSWDFKDVSFSAGGIVYTFPHVKDSTTAEAYLGASYDTILQPSLTVYYDFVQADGFYASLGVGHSFDLMDNALYKVDSDIFSASLDLSANMGWASKNWNNFYYGADHSTFVDLLVGASLPIGITDYVTVSPSASYSTVTDGTLRTKVSNDHEWILGVTVSAEM